MQQLSEEDIKAIADKIYETQCKSGTVCPLGLKEKDVNQFKTTAGIAGKFGVGVAWIIISSAVLGILTAFGLGVREVIKQIVHSVG